MSDTDVTVFESMDPDELHLVKAGANGFPALLAKAAAEEVAEVLKAEESTKTQNDLDDDQFGYIEPGGEKDAEGKTTPRSLRHFPVNDAAHVRNALARAGQSPFGEKALPKIRAAAKKFGVEVSDDVAKAAQAQLLKLVGEQGWSVEVVRGFMAKADGDGTPGDAAWETQDSALLHNAAAMLAHANTLLETAQGREKAEVEAGVEGDYGDVCDLDQAMCCLDQALGIVARLVYTEAAEATAAGNGDGTTVAKAGRRLSAKTVAALNDLIAKANTLLAGDQKSDTPKTETEGAAGTDKEDSDMNDAELAKALDDRDAKLTETITTSLTAAVADMIKGLAPQAAPETSAATAPAPAAQAPAASDPNEALVKGLADAFKEAVTPLEERLAKMEAQPRRGVGPLAQIPRGGTGSTDLAATVKDLLAKAAAEPNPDVANRHRERASMLALSVGQNTGRFYDESARVPYEMPSTD